MVEFIIPHRPQQSQHLVPLLLKTWFFWG